MRAIVLGVLGACAVLACGADNLVDETLAKHAVAVLRVERTLVWDLPHYPLTRYQVHVIHIYKNESNLPIGDFAVHGFKGRAGVPPGECTIYIERYDVSAKKFGGTNGTIWMLVGGDATNGVSHRAESASGVHR